MAVADNFMWFPDESGAFGKSNPEGETSDAWFAKKKAFELTSFDFTLRQSQTDEDVVGGSGSGDDDDDPVIDVRGLFDAPGNMAATGGGDTGFKPGFREFQIEKPVDYASAMLYRACSMALSIPTAMLAVRKAGGNNLLYLQYMFRGVKICQISWKGGSGTEAAKETLKLTCKAMGMQYVQQLAGGKAGGKIRWDWNASLNSSTLDDPKLGKAPQFLMPTQWHVS